VCDAKKAFLGLARRVHGVSRLDEAGLIRALGRASERTADRLAPARLRHEADSDAHRHMVETNKRLAEDARPITAEEKDAAAQLRQASKFGRAVTISDAAEFSEVKPDSVTRYDIIEEESPTPPKSSW
jgi:hypothetical protein